MADHFTPRQEKGKLAVYFSVMAKRAFECILLLAAMLCIAGCGVQAKQPSAGVTQFYFSSGTYVGLILIPLLLAAIGVSVLIKGELILKVFAAGGLLILLLYAVVIFPGIWADTVIVDSQGVRQKTGFWWNQTVKQINYAQTKEVHIVQKPAGPDNRIQVVWEIVRKDNSAYDLNPGDLWDHAEGEIIKSFQQHGVDVRDSR
jgi:hypothetical protein